MMIKYFLNSTKGRIIIYFSLIFLFLNSLTGIIIYRYFSNVFFNEIISYSVKIVEEATLTIDSYFNHLKTTMEVTGGSRVVLSAVETYLDPDSAQGEKIEAIWEIDDAFADILKFNPDIKDIILIDNSGKALHKSGVYKSLKNDYDFNEQEWFDKDFNGYLKVKFLGIHPQDYYLNPKESQLGERIISTIIPVVDVLSINKKQHAVILCNIDANNIDEITKELRLEETGYFLIIDNNDEIVYKPKDVDLDEGMLKIITGEMADESGHFFYSNTRKEFLVAYDNSRITGWRILAAVPSKEIYAHLRSLGLIIIIVSIASVSLVVLSTIFISSRINRPIIRLIKLMGNIEKGNFDLKLYDNSSEEIEKLSSRIDLMIERINALNKDLYSYKFKSKEAEIRALQAQINPHFLYNALQLIKSMAVCKNLEGVGKIVTLLGNMLRYAVYNPKELVTIYDEIAHVKEYIQIQNFRYPGKFKYRIECGKDIGNNKIPKLVMQPLVENIFTHGFKNSDRIVIKISSETKRNGVYINICDNGSGIDEESAKKITRHLEDSSRKDKSDSIGLKNVNERIRLKFGKPYGVRIIPRHNSWTCIRVYIPKNYGEVEI